MKDRDRSIVTNAKIVPYETVAPQHRPLICTVRIAPPRLKQIERCGAARVKWLELGTTKPRRRKVDKQAWLWTDDVKAKRKQPTRYAKLQGSKGEESTGVLAQQYDDSDLEEEGQSCGLLQLPSDLLAFAQHDDLRANPR
ncbi:unnamed protein product [Heligmosomoides polygyrus]|uniref:Uncharacterized protein n=1 Tax=Heligmosomoides polygyrus TaxID=6339 RepID=A0A183GV00_HELPZ|nr:unnamed protein product [Heligmosomoides polygyrus]